MMDCRHPTRGRGWKGMGGQAAAGALLGLSGQQQPDPGFGLAPAAEDSPVGQLCRDLEQAGEGTHLLRGTCYVHAV